MIEVSIVAGTWNRLPLLQQMVYSVRKSAGAISYEIVLTDGGSTDGTLAWIKDEPDIRLIEHGELRGAIAAFNDASAIAIGHYVILSNDDIIYRGDSIRRAVDFMSAHPDVGIGLFYTNRNNKADHIAYMPAHHPDGSFTSVPYGGLSILPRWLGNKLNWWSLPKPARTYGGDCALCARAIEAGYPVVPMEGCIVDEKIPHDELNRINNPPSSDDHPDTQVYLKLFPRGPELGHTVELEVQPAPLRILYAPIYEHKHKIQHTQKRGLRRALQRIGLVREIDYAELGPERILVEAEAWQPDMVLTQLHYPEPFTPDHALKLRELLPNALLVNWNGDTYNMAIHPDFGEAYCELLRHFDLHTVVNASAIPDYERANVRAAWWQIGYEPDGVGHAPDANTPAHDVVFMGTGYSDQRQAFGTSLKKLPYRVGVYGDYWPFRTNGQTLYDFKRGCQLYRNARIAVGDSEWGHAARGFVSNRPFQAMAAGGCLMLQQEFDGCEELLHLVSGRHLVLWSDFGDLRKKIDYWLDPAHELERRAIAARGQSEVLINHSFEARVKTLMGILRALGKPLK